MQLLYAERGHNRLIGSLEFLDPGSGDLPFKLDSLVLLAVLNRNSQHFRLTFLPHRDRKADHTPKCEWSQHCEYLLQMATLTRWNEWKRNLVACDGSPGDETKCRPETKCSLGAGCVVS